MLRISGSGGGRVADRGEEAGWRADGEEDEEVVVGEEAEEEEEVKRR